MLASTILTGSDTHRAIETVFRIESARVIAGLTRLTRDVGLAEELAQEALVAALERWPQSGIPDNPAAWLMATGKHRAIDRFRRNRLISEKHAELGRDLEEAQEGPDLDTALDDEIGDDLLRLVFVSCHPVLPTPARVALTLRLLGGLTTDEIARAFLVSEPTVSQRIVRAKRTLAEHAFRSRCRVGTISPPAWRQCSRSSTSSSTRATRRPPATTGCGPRCARKRSASAAFSPSWRRMSRRCTVSLR
jgi:RNA polymerase sigma factor (sigma-70 family)